MPKYQVYAKIVALKYIGEFEADSQEEAISKAENSDTCYAPTLCNQCAHEIDLGDICELEAEESN